MKCQNNLATTHFLKDKQCPIREYNNGTLEEKFYKLPIHHSMPQQKKKRKKAASFPVSPFSYSGR